jgi:predicted enzyme related to lactoylglutathione lyase
MGGTRYWLIKTVPTDEKGMPLNPVVKGGLFQSQPQQKGINQVNYITIEFIDEYLAKVEKLGGRILVT